MQPGDEESAASRPRLRRPPRRVGASSRAPTAATSAPAATFELPLPADYLPGPTLRSWGRDPASLTERVEGNRILRTVRLAPEEPRGVLLEVTLERRLARCRVEADG